MTLEEFIKETQERLIRFEEVWKRNNKLTPEYFPDTMEPGEWDEQFMIFNGEEDEN